MTWQIKFDPRAQKELKKLDKKIQKRIIFYLKERIVCEDNPRCLGSALKGDKTGLWRYRVGDYRIICKIKDDELLVLVIKVGHRGSTY
ncbi:MAG: type II toxin-antitoxin system RelE/ParE family toxin [Gloeocapsa sp. DLM2.Bin57]|nr:MAG: type II toxin-antitoxin system RelE/ParE family toxin [Gloeocapsa sp. DLM2.Bin57]